MFGTIITSITSLLDKIIPDPKQASDAKFKLLELVQNGELKQQEIQLSAIISESKSQDKWTSRARPTFLYVIYIMILTSIPMGVIHALNPLLASNIESGMGQWLKAIPEALWQLFGVGYLGYTAGRTWDKHVEAKKSK